MAGSRFPLRGELLFAFGRHSIRSTFTLPGNVSSNAVFTSTEKKLQPD
jgi:hypothetical protein